MKNNCRFPLHTFVFTLLFATFRCAFAQTAIDSATNLNKIIEPKFIPITIDKEFLNNVRKSAEAKKQSNQFIYNVPGEIEDNYLKNHKHLVVQTMNEDVYRGKLVCVSQHGIYIYQNKYLGLQFIDYREIDWIRRGRSYGNVLWKTGFLLGSYFGFNNFEKSQSIEAVADGYVMGAMSSITFMQVLLAPIYTMRLNFHIIKFNIQSNENKGKNYYKMVIADQEMYSNMIDYKTFPGFDPFQNQ